MANAFFITGTDTEVGKTYVTCEMLRSFRAMGKTTLAMKPLAAGAEEAEPGVWRNEDALLLQEAMTELLPYQQLNPICLKQPVAPHIAAANEGKTLSAGRIAGFCRGAMMQKADVKLIEGAGGWRVPLNPRENLSDLVRELNIPVIMVVGLKLGCLNHALLTADAIRTDGCKLAGWVANQLQPEPMEEQAGNIQTLMQRLPAPLLGHVPFKASLQESAGSVLDVTKLAELIEK